MKGEIIMKQFLYETHLHTEEASACAILSGAEQARLYKEAGYTGIIVTDHFFNGNSCISKELPWGERIDLFCRGYEEAKAEGDRIGLSVFFGWESTYDTQDFLIYGLDKEWLKGHPEMLSWSVEEQYKYVHADGGYVVQAHPFRIRPYIKKIRVYPNSVDAVEVINVGNCNAEYDRQAEAYAKVHQLPGLAGTDNHGRESWNSGVAFDTRVNSIEEFLGIIKSGNYQLIRPKETI
jgi:hypothetical protein